MLFPSQQILSAVNEYQGLCPATIKGLQIRADAPEISTKILFFIIMKSVNYPHANLANLAEGASLRPRLSAFAECFQPDGTHKR